MKVDLLSVTVSCINVCPKLLYQKVLVEGVNMKISHLTVKCTCNQ